MEYELTAIAKLKLSYAKGASTSKHETTKFFLEVSDNVDKSQFLKDGLPTKDGSKALKIVLTMALVGNIHMADQNGFKDSAEHLREIIDLLEKGVFDVAEVSKDVF